jgi:hypothetical protein
VSMFYKIMWIGQDNGLTRGWMIWDLIAGRFVPLPLHPD